MPIYEPDLSYEDMQKAVHTFKCAQCGNYLLIAWSAHRNSYMLRCGQSLEHEGVVPLGRDPEIQEINALLRGGPKIMETTQLTKLDQNQMLARVDQARFPKDLTLVDRQLIAQVSIEYGLDPIFNELMIYQGRPYVTIDARRRKAQETEKLDGISARPATTAERKARQVSDGDYLFVAEVWVKGASHPFEGWGTVRAAETKGSEHLPVVKDPAAMAEKRAEAHALRRAFHLPLPSFEEIVEGEFEEPPQNKQAPQSKTSPPKAQPRPIAPKPAGTITQPQHQKIWADAKKMGYSEDDIHAIIKYKWGFPSINELSVAQASDLIGMIGRGEGIPAPDKEQAEEEIEDLWAEGEE